MLWRLQVAVVVLVAVGLAASPWVHPGMQAILVISSVLAAVQLTLTAAVVFSFTSDVTLLPGRFVGGALLLYALARLLRVEAGLHVHAPAYAQEVERAATLCLIVAMLSGAATAFWLRVYRFEQAADRAAVAGAD